MADFTPYRKLISVTEADCDHTGRMGAAAMVYYLQEAASAHAELLDVGIPRLSRLGALWVVTRMSLELTRLPEKGGNIYVETWPGKTRHVLFPRYYAIRSEDGETLARGAGIWMLIHPESRKMLFPEEIGLQVPDLSSGDEPALPDRRVRFPETLAGLGTHTAGENELDVNGHVNNVHYLRWAEELLPEGFAYADSYDDVPADVKQYYSSGYFAQDYACISASEDRATMIEKAMLGEAAVFEANPHLLPKLQYYCDCIRDSFDTAGWQEILPWEQLLEQ